MRRKSFIFEDKRKLSPRYVPRFLPHREEQLRFLWSLYSDSLEHIHETYLLVCQLIGPLGTGKTVTALRFGQLLEEEASKRSIRLKHIYLNCKVGGVSRVVLYRGLVGEAAPEVFSRSLSPEELLRELLKHLRREGRYVFITVDEIEHFCKHSKEHMVYDLTRLNELYPGEPTQVVGVAFIARDTSFYGCLDPSELSTLGKLVIEFPRYTADQIKDILEQRADEAFQPGAISEGVLELISDITVRPPINGDVRVALDLLLYAGNLAENLGCESVVPDHVRRVRSETHPTITTQDILCLNETEKLILLGMARSLEGESEPYLTRREVCQVYACECEGLGIQPVEDIDEHIDDLCKKGIMEMKSLTKIGLLDVPAEGLRRLLNGLMERVEDDLEEE